MTFSSLLDFAQPWEGIQVFVETQVLHVNGRSGGKVSLEVRTTAGDQNIEGSDVLVAVGRIPNTSGIGLAQAGVELDRFV